MAVVLRRDRKHEDSKSKKSRISWQTYATILPLAIILPPLEIAVSRNNAISTKI